MNLAFPSPVEKLDNHLKKFQLFDILLECSKYSLEVLDTNNAISSYSIKLNGIDHSATVTQWGIAFIAYRAILSSNDFKKNKFAYHPFLVAHGLFTEIPEVLDTDTNVFCLFRMAQEQFPWQSSFFRHQVARYYWIFSNSRFKDDFVSLFGLNIEEYFFIGFAIYAIIRQNRFFSIRLATSTSTRLQGILTEEKIRLFLSLSASDYWGIRGRAKESLSLPRYERFEFNPLIKYPLVKLDPRLSRGLVEYTAPSLPMLMDKISKGIYWDLRDKHREGKSVSFVNAFGDIFKSFIGEILKHYFTEGTISDLDKDPAFSSNKKADWMVNLPSCTLIFECKSTLMPQSLKQTFDPVILQNWFKERNITSGVDQLLSTKEQVKHLNKPIYCFLVLMEDLFFAEDPEVKRLIHKDYTQFYVLRSAELESMEFWIKKYGIERVIQEKQKIDAAWDRSQPIEFSQICQKIEGHAARNTFLEEFTDDLFKLKPGTSAGE